MLVRDEHEPRLQSLTLKLPGLNPDPPIKLTFLVRSLDYGGAQRQLISLVRALDKNRFSISILVFYPGPLAEELADNGVQLTSLEKLGRWDIFGFLRRLVHQIRVIQPDVIHGYLDIPNLLALFLKLFVRTRVIWGLRASQIDLQPYDWLRRLAAETERRLARWADLIIINSATGLERHVARGFPREKMLLVYNGFDTEEFKPDREAGEVLRRKWGVAAQTRLVGIVGRLDPMKDQQNFLQAAALVCRRGSDAGAKPDGLNWPPDDVRFVCVGDGPVHYREELELLAHDLGLAEKLIWQTATTDIVAVYNALDLLVSASRTEGLPNVVGEAMACGVTCVVTDVGDSRMLIGDCGVVVPPQDSVALAEGIIRRLAVNRDGLGREARTRIIENFSTKRLAEVTKEGLLALMK